MRRRRTPGWVMELKRAAGAPEVPALRLTDLIGTVEVRCEPCDRRGCYRADRLIAEFGDLYMPELLDRIAKRGQCYRALNPPTPASHDYGSGNCRIMLVRRPDVT